MPMTLKFGKKPAVADDRVPRMSIATRGRLPPAPPWCDWWSKVPAWGMLGNDQAGDCVFAAIDHAVMQMSAYAGAPLIADTIETLNDYSRCTGYDAENPLTDQGTVVLGRDGAIQYWASQGVTVDQHLNKVTGFLRITHKDPNQWRQGVYIFGGMLTGIRVPASLMAGDSIPLLWDDPTDLIPNEGHEIWINGFHMVNGMYLYDLISWGQHCQITESCLRAIVDETVVVVNPVSINARGVDASSLSMAQLVTDMRLLRNQG